jgi:hypothetical protein
VDRLKCPLRAIRHIARFFRPGTVKFVLAGLIRALPAGITDRVGRDDQQRVPAAPVDGGQREDLAVA